MRDARDELAIQALRNVRQEKKPLLVLQQAPGFKTAKEARMSRLKLFFLQAAAGFLFWTAILTPYMLWVVDMTNVQYWKWVGMNLLFASILSPTSVWFINWFVGRFSGRAKEYLVTITARDPGLAAGFRSTDRYVMEADTPAAALRKARAEAPRHWEWFPNATLEIEVYDRVADERLERTAGAAGGR